MAYGKTFGGGSCSNRFLGLLSQFYPKKVYDVSRNNFRHTEDHQVYQELFFPKTGKYVNWKIWDFI